MKTTIYDSKIIPLPTGEADIVRSCVLQKGHKVLQTSKRRGEGANRNAFTLAEVLITLSVIGVVAALTLPNLLSKTDDRENLVALKKVYSELTQVRNQLDWEYGGTFTTACNNYNDTCFRDLFASKMKVAKTCDSTVPNDCQATSKFEDGSLQKWDTRLNDRWPTLVTENGYSVKFRFHTNGCVFAEWSGETCGWMQVDTNGKKRPNVFGKDIFIIYLYKNTMIPVDFDKPPQENGRPQSLLLLLK